jgi:hypothetical protein
MLAPMDEKPERDHILTALSPGKKFNSLLEQFRKSSTLQAAQKQRGGTQHPQ